jgi:hypothetical protein
MHGLATFGRESRVVALATPASSDEAVALGLRALAGGAVDDCAAPSPSRPSERLGEDAVDDPSTLCRSLDLGDPKRQVGASRGAR